MFIGIHKSIDLKKARSDYTYKYLFIYALSFFQKKRFQKDLENYKLQIILHS